MLKGLTGGFELWNGGCGTVLLGGEVADVTPREKLAEINCYMRAVLGWRVCGGRWLVSLKGGGLTKCLHRCVAMAYGMLSN